jgi:tRNA uracil 4-sulfurtransferase
MKYDRILIRYGEMTTKGKNRNRFVSILRQNIATKLKRFENLKYEATRDRMYIMLNGEDHVEVMEDLRHVFGIHTFSLAMRTETDLDDIKAGVLAAFEAERKDAKTFKITTRRSYKEFPLETMELNQELGAHILINAGNIGVDVHNPDIDVRVEVRKDATYITCSDIKGAGGYPVGVGGKVMLLLSGGIDSPVAGYLTMKRGVTVEAVHFHSPPYTSERAKQKVVDLARHLTKYCRGVVLHVVPFTDIQKMIHKKVPSNYEMTVMRRVMLRVTERIAEKRKAMALATGESLGQVASQTLDSMNAINEVTNYPIIRPLITMDKLEIIDIAKQIDTYDISIRPYEDCCTIFTPANPATKPKREKAKHFEELFDYEELIQEAVERTEKIILQQEVKQVEEEFKDLL